MDIDQVEHTWTGMEFEPMPHFVSYQTFFINTVPKSLDIKNSTKHSNSEISMNKLVFTEQMSINKTLHWAQLDINSTGPFVI